MMLPNLFPAAINVTGIFLAEFEPDEFVEALFN